MLGDRDVAVDQIGEVGKLVAQCLPQRASRDAITGSPPSDGISPNAQGDGDLFVLDAVSAHCLGERELKLHATGIPYGNTFTQYPAVQGQYHLVLQAACSMTLGGRIAARRIELGLSQNELARRSGLNHPTLHRIESGKSADPSVSLVIKIAKALGTSIEALVSGTELAAPLTPPTPVASEAESRLPEGPFADAIHLLRGEIAAVMAVALEARETAEEAKRSIARRARKSA